MKLDFTKVTRFAGKIGLGLKKASPEIMLVGGVVGVVAATVLACHATLKAKDVVEETHEELDEVEIDALERGLPEKYRKRAVFKVYVHQTAKFAKIYAIPVALGTLSLGLIIGSHCVLNRRYIGTAAAYKAVDEAFKAYRKRISEMIGEEDEKNIYLGKTGKKISMKEEDGEDETNAIITPDGVIINPKYNHSPWARFFDEHSTEWKKNAEYNKMFLAAQQTYATNLLRRNGHLFLNEVYDMLGLPRSRAGAVVGWLLGEGDDYVDFSLYDDNESARDFINGYDRSILLDFNVDGVIYDKI